MDLPLLLSNQWFRLQWACHDFSCTRLRKHWVFWLSTSIRKHELLGCQIIQEIHSSWLVWIVDRNNAVSGLQEMVSSLSVIVVRDFNSHDSSSVDAQPRSNDEQLQQWCNYIWDDSRIICLHRMQCGYWDATDYWSIIESTFHEHLIWQQLIVRSRFQ